MSTIAKKFTEMNEALVKETGDWTAHDIYLGEGVYTRAERNEPFPYRLKKLVQSSFDITDSDPESLRVLDLGCLEGGVSIEFARHGCHVVGIEGRSDNTRKGELIRDLLGLENLKFVTDDVLNMTEERYGRFDVILCLGILYHVDAKDLLPFVAKMYEMCNRVVIVDTHIAMNDEAKDSFTSNGCTYSGKSMKEHPLNSTQDQKMDRKWASLNNDFSFWPTKTSLINMFADAGFSSVFEIHHPFFISYSNRLMLAAIKGPAHQVNYPADTVAKVEKSRRPENLDAPKSEWGCNAADAKTKTGKIARLKPAIKAFVQTIRSE